MNRICKLAFAALGALCLLASAVNPWHLVTAAMCAAIAAAAGLDRKNEKEEHKHEKEAEGLRGLAE